MLASRRGIKNGEGATCPEEKPEELDECLLGNACLAGNYGREGERGKERKAR